MIIIKKIDEVFSQIITTKDILMEIYDNFYFRPDNYQFMPAYKNRLWDGKIHLINLKNGKMMSGFIPRLEKFFSDRGYEYSIENHGDKLKITMEEFQEFLSEIYISMSPYEHQLISVFDCYNRNQSILLSPTSSGKEYIIYLFIQLIRWVNPENKFLILVPTTSLVEQIRKGFSKYSLKENKEFFDVDRDVHVIYSGKEKDSNKDIIISTWQSVFRKPADWFHKFTCLICDEAHGAKGNSVTKIIENCKNSKFRFGCTGTLGGIPVNEELLKGLFGGKVLKYVTTKDLIDSDKVSRFKIRMIELIYSKESKKGYLTKFSYAEEMNFLEAHRKRNDFICFLANSISGNTLILFKKIEHGKILFDLLKNTGKKVFFIDGSIGVEEREIIRETLDKEKKDCVLVASLGTTSTGVSINHIHNVIFCSPMKSEIKVLQSIGRSLRKSDDGKSATLYDICDNINSHNYSYKHAQDRLNIYEKEKHTIIQKNIDF